MGSNLEIRIFHYIADLELLSMQFPKEKLCFISYSAVSNFVRHIRRDNLFQGFTNFAKEMFRKPSQNEEF